MRVSQHADERIRERCGLPKRAVEKNAAKALSDGITHEETSGRLKKYLDFLFLTHRRATNIRIYGCFVYLFTKHTLITVFPLPRDHLNATKKIIQRRKTQAEG
jgi:hypothetical protein